MSRRIVVVDANGERSLDDGDWPLKIGCQPGVDIRVAGLVTDGDVALIDILDERPFLQRMGNTHDLTVNEEAVSSNRWLSDGDVIASHGTTISCVLNESETRFIVTAPVDYATLPPEIILSDDDSDDDIEITPIRNRSPAARLVVNTEGNRRAKQIGFGALIILLVVAVYLFTSKAVLIEIMPVDAEVSIAGGLLKPKFGDRYLLRPGTYQVIAKAGGYIAASEDIVVDAAANQTFSFQLEKLPGRLAVETQPQITARVLIDGDYLGSTADGPLTVTPGAHNVLIESDRYLDFSGSVEIEGRDLLQTFQAELSPGWADVKFITTPVGVTILVNNEAVGETPTTVEIMAGQHDIVLRKEGYKSRQHSLTTIAGGTNELTGIHLDVADASLRVTTQPPGAAISIDGRYRGKTPVVVDLAPDKRYAVIVTKPGFASVSRTVHIATRQEQFLNLKLEARTGDIQISSIPADAELFIDGRSVGRTGQSLTLPAREHRIEIRKAGFAPYKTKIMPKPGLPGRLEARLLTPDEAILAAYPQVIQTSQGASLRLVGPGQFMLGAKRREQGRRPNESQHEVRLTRPFYIALHEVTNEQFRAFKPKHTSGAEKYRQLGDSDHPVVQLSWEDATGYCNWLSGKDGLPFAYVIKDGKIKLALPLNSGYRLPTEAEWVWAARYSGGGPQRKYPWGDQMPPGPGAGNYADESARSILGKVLSNYNDEFPITAPVGRFQANPVGLFDLGGNVAEWVNDRYGIYTDRSVEVDPIGPVDGQYHVIRGSGWRHSSIGELRLAYRDFGDRGRLDVGFRIARYTDAETQDQD